MPDLIVVGRAGSKRLAVLFYVTQRDIRAGVNAARAGRLAHRGAWWARDARGGLIETRRPNLRDPDAFGKVEGAAGLRIGRVPAQPSAFLLRRLR